MPEWTDQCIGLIVAILSGLPVCSIFYFVWKRTLFSFVLVILFLSAVIGGLVMVYPHMMTSPSSEIGFLLGTGLSGAYFSYRVNPSRPELLGFSYWKNYSLCILLAFAMVMWPVRICHYLGTDDRSWISLPAVCIFWTIREFSLRWMYQLTAASISTLAIDYAFQRLCGTSYVLSLDEYPMLIVFLLCIAGAILIPERITKTSRKGGR